MKSARLEFGRRLYECELSASARDAISATMFADVHVRDIPTHPVYVCFKSETGIERRRVGPLLLTDFVEEIRQ